MKRARSQWESLLEIHMRERGLHPEVEYRFHPERMWRFDFAFPAEKVGVEVEGVTRYGGLKRLGRHQTYTGIEADCQKYSTAAVMGWCVIRATQGMISSLEAVSLVERALQIRRAAA